MMPPASLSIEQEIAFYHERLADIERILNMARGSLRVVARRAVPDYENKRNEVILHIIALEGKGVYDI